MSNLTDVVGGDKMFGYSFMYTTDRFCNTNSAIRLQNTYLNVPSGVYFSGDFTIIAWIKINTNQNSIILNFGNAGANFYNNVIFAIYYSLTCSFSSCLYLRTNSILNISTWYHVALVLEGNTGYIYVDGSLVNSGPQYSPINATRSSYYIGQIYSISSSYYDTTFDELRIYQGAMQQIDIRKDYTTSSTSGIFVLYANLIKRK